VELINERKTPGNYEANFYMPGLAGGISSKCGCCKLLFLLTHVTQKIFKIAPTPVRREVDLCRGLLITKYIWL
jgi:hypothetical protein